MINLDQFFRGDFTEDPGTALQAFMRAVLVRTQFLPATRHIIGWRGIKQSAAEVDGWSAKIKDYAGVFGIYFLGVEPISGWSAGRFGLCYFPDPQEPLVERCSLSAAALTQNETYQPGIREFLRRPHMCDLFAIGTLLLSVNSDCSAVALSLESFTSLRTIAANGVHLERGGRVVTLVEPGGYDQDFPGFETALAFFDVLAASVTFNLTQPPGWLLERRYPANHKVYRRSGAVLSRKDPDLRRIFLAIGYGDGDFGTLCTELPASGDMLSALGARGPGEAPTYADKLWWRAHQLTPANCIDKKLLGVDERPPLILLTGFLGAGKTSFLQNFIEYQTQRHRFVAVIQNEIGAIGLDGKLLDYTVTEIDEGCVCCSLAGNLIRAVRGILEHFSPDCIILETSGLANPLNLLDEAVALSECVRLDATVTVVDALNLNGALSDTPIAADQIRAADILLINKCDLVDADRLQAVQRNVQAINPRAPLFCTVNGDLNPALIFDADDSIAHAPFCGKGILPDAPHRHVAHAETGLWSRSVTFSGPLDREKFLQIVGSLPTSVFRAKGLLDFSDIDRPMLFQYVCGRYELSAFPNMAVRERFLTLIGKGSAIDQDLLSALQCPTLTHH